MPYVKRDEAGKVIGLFANPQPDMPEEWLEDDDPEVIAYLNPPVAPTIPCPTCGGTGRLPAAP